MLQLTPQCVSLYLQMLLNRFSVMPGTSYFFVLMPHKFSYYLSKIPLWPCAASLFESLSGFFLPLHCCSLPITGISTSTNHSRWVVDFQPFTAVVFTNIIFKVLHLHIPSIFSSHLTFSSIFLLSTQGNTCLPVHAIPSQEDVHLHIHTL